MKGPYLVLTYYFYPLKFVGPLSLFYVGAFEWFLSLQLNYLYFMNTG